MRRLYFAAAALGVLFLGGAGGFAAEKIIGDQLSGSVVLTDTERAALEPELARYCALEGSSGSLRKLIESYVKNDCRDECMADLLGLVNARIKNGLTCDKAIEEVMGALNGVREYSRAKGIKPTPQELARAVRANVEKGSAKSAPAELAPGPMIR